MDAYAAYWYVSVRSFSDSLSICSSSFALLHTPRFQILGHSLGTTSIRNSLKSGLRVSNNSILSTMLSRGMGLVVRRMEQGDHLHRRMGCRPRPRRLHNPSSSPGPGSGASTGLDPRFRARCVLIVVMIFFLACFISMYIFCTYLGGEGGMGCT